MRPRLLPVALLAAAALTAPAGASAPMPLPTPCFASDDVAWLGDIPLHADPPAATVGEGQRCWAPLA